MDLVYEDRKNQFRQEDSLSFSETDKANKTFSVDLRDPSQRRVGFTITFLDKNGGVFQIPKSYTLDNRIFLRGDMRGHRVIAVRAPGVDFAAKKLAEFQVQLRYIDTAAALQYSGQAALRAAADEAAFEFDYVDPAKSAYEYKLALLFRNGMAQDFDWKSSDADDLNLEL